MRKIVIHSLLSIGFFQFASLDLSAAPKNENRKNSLVAEKQQEANKAEKEPDVVYVPTPQEVVELMLEMAKVGKNDIVYDLGSGDGRIPITAAQKFGAKKSVGVELRPELLKEARDNAKKAGVDDRTEFRQQDLFETDFSEATVVTLYLLPSLNLKLRKKLLTELKPGSRIVSHSFDMGSWKPDLTQQRDGRTVYLWTVPKEVPENLL